MPSIAAAVTPCARSQSVIGRILAGSARTSFRDGVRHAAAGFVQTDGGGAAHRGRRPRGSTTCRLSTDSDSPWTVWNGIGYPPCRRDREGAVGAGKHPPSRRSLICGSFTAGGCGSIPGATASAFATGRELPAPRSKLRGPVPLSPPEDATAPPSPLNVAGQATGSCQLHPSAAR